jgi:hypothetical protein
MAWAFVSAEITARRNNRDSRERWKGRPGVVRMRPESCSIVPRHAVVRVKHASKTCLFGCLIAPGGVQRGGVKQRRRVLPIPRIHEDGKVMFTARRIGKAEVDKSVPSSGTGECSRGLTKIRSLRPWERECLARF